MSKFSMMGSQIVRHYPTDPFAPLQDIITYLTQPNHGGIAVKKLFSDLYDLVGYGLYLAEGNDTAAQQVYHSRVSELLDSRKFTLPPWLIPVLQTVLQSVLQNMGK